MGKIPTILPVPQLPIFRWNVKAKRYISGDGRFVSTERIRTQLDKYIGDVTKSMESVSRSLISGDISLAGWQSEMMALIKETNLAGGALEQGGWYNMTSSSFGRTGHKIRGEYDYLRKFAEDIYSGKQKLNGTLVNRARLYGQQGRVIYYDFAKVTAIKDGFIEEASFLTPSESCQECIDEAAKGFVAIGSRSVSITPIGSRECLSNCNCFMMYRDGKGKTRSV